MRRTFTIVTVLAIGLALGLALPAAAAAPKDLRVSSTNCGGVGVVAEGMPASSQLLLLARNLTDGKVLNMGGKPTPVMSNASGMVNHYLHANLRSVRTVDVSIWTKKGETLTMQAKDTATANCGPLPMTGSPTVQWQLLLGALLLVAGAAALWLSRRQPARATP
jgi:LPXTG-motif cell wall-anchored protein